MKIGYVLDKEDLDILSEMLSEAKWEIAGAYGDDGSRRSGKVAWLDHYDIDVSTHLKLLNMVPNSTLYVSEEWQFADYQKGDLFKKHIDTIPGVPNARRYTMVTMMEKSEDLKGGNLLVYINNEVKEVDLNVGQTILFESAVPHEVTPILEGSRRTLVNWFRFRD